MSNMASRRPNPSIFMTSPPSEHAHPNHPRRPPAKRSVSLLHAQSRQPSRLKEATSPPSDNDASKDSAPSGGSGATDSPSSLQALGGRGSSGESSNAEKWFEKSNNEVRENSASFADNDPPFFMRNSSSSETPPDVQQLRQQPVSIADGANSLPLRTGLLHLGTDGSSTEDFRSVIDDLTIENKHLKRRLKKYEKLHDSHLKDEKLFEVRIHGLPAEKKRELEETLRKFASSLGPAGANAFPANGYASLMPMLKTVKGTSSQTSLHHSDSAYASMSASGQGSSALPADDRRMTPSSYPAVRRQNIQNYLHHIPEGLLPQPNPSTMTERAKKKLVVRRMEQIFAGKGAAAAGHQQSIQQEEVSQSAARTDRTDMEERGQRVRKEGAREANIMSPEAEEPADAAPPPKPQPSDRGTKRPTLKEETSVSHEPDDQRPTRPLDLDPHRAQVPAENIRYLRQMGFSPLDPESSRSLVEGHGWIYLNFLINMAQLHTINVTTDFVRKAIGEYSGKFEVSSDGRKVRWKGGDSVTRSSDSGGGSSNDRTSNNTPDEQSPRKRQKLSHTDGRPNLQQAGALSARSQQETNRYAYTPLFFHRENSDEGDDSSSEEGEDDNISSPFPAVVAGNSSGMTSSGIRTNSGFPVAAIKKKPKHDDGPIIFYNNARFCTDLSGDRQGHVNYNAPSYAIASTVPIGKQRTGTEDPAETRGPLAHASDLPEPMDLSDNPIPESMELSFPEQSPPRPQSLKEQNPIDLEVTGIGGVWPADNFSISVESRQTRVDQQQQPGVTTKTSAKALPPRLAGVLRGDGTKASMSAPLPSLQKRVVASKVRELPPSELPPALNFMPFGDESEEEDSDAEDNESEAPESLGAFPPSAAPQPVEIGYGFNSEDEDDDDDDDEEESDGEIDFLAAARAAEPEAVRRQEREYEANMAERLADEIPAGSSAATAGGGSGYASPASGAVSREEYWRALKEARGGAAKQKSAKASDSMVVNPMKDSSSDNSSG